jgi:hypothetical protein
MNNKGWELNNDCLNLVGDLDLNQVSDILKIERIRVIQPWKFMPSNETWQLLNEHLFKNRPTIEFHIWADTIKSDFSFLGKMSNVNILDLNQVKFKNKKTLGYLTQLKSLTLINGNVNELDFLKELTNLEYLCLGRIRGLNDISFISELKKLKELEINNQAQLTELPDFEELRELKILKLFSIKNLFDVSKINSIKNLEELHFFNLHTEIEPDQFEFLNSKTTLKKVAGNFNKQDKSNRFETLTKEINCA